MTERRLRRGSDNEAGEREKRLEESVAYFVKDVVLTIGSTSQRLMLTGEYLSAND